MRLNDEDTIRGYKVLLFAIAIATQSIFVSTGDLSSFSEYISYIASFPILFGILLWLDINADNVIVGRHLKPFSLTTTQSLLTIWSYLLFNKRYWLYIVVIYSSLLLVPNLGVDHRILYFVWSVLQTLVFLLAMIVLYEFLERRELARHLLIVPTLSVMLAFLLQDTDKAFLLTNPFSVGCAAVGFLHIHSFLITMLISFFAFVALSFVLFMLYHLRNWI